MYADARKARRWSSAADTPWATRLIVRRGLPTLGSRQSRGPVAICVFCVHPLVSAFEFLLCDAADRCGRQIEEPAAQRRDLAQYDDCKCPRWVAANGCAVKLCVHSVKLCVGLAFLLPLPADGRR